MPKEKKEIHPVDAYAGNCLRQARQLRGISQTQLGNRLSCPITFQQVQKYEQGINRISVSRMYEFIKVLQLPLTFFLPDSEAFTTPFPNTRETSLLHYYRQLPSDAQDGLLALLNARNQT